MTALCGWLFVLLSSLLLYIFAGYPLLLGLLARRYGRPHRRMLPRRRPRVSILLAAYNEEAVLAAKVRSCLEQTYPARALEVIAVSDASSDRSDEILRRLARRDRRLRVLRQLERGGKNRALNRAIAHARGEILVFTDANALFQPDTLVELVSAFADPAVGCVVGELRLHGEERGGSAPSEGLYWRYEARLKRLESALGSCLVGNGSLLAMRAELAGSLDPEIANDFQQPMEVAGQGYRVIYEPRAIAAELSAESFREELERRIRIITRGITGYRRLGHTLHGFRRLAFWSHKGLRWGTGLILLGIWGSNLVLCSSGVAWMVLFGLQNLCYLRALGAVAQRLRGRDPGRFGALCLYVCTLSLAGIAAIARSFAGRRCAVWRKPESARWEAQTEPPLELIAPSPETARRSRPRVSSRHVPVRGSAK